jgi:RNA polymerase sigma-70 factor (ECF subfamily)
VVSLDVSESGPLGPRPAEQLVQDRARQPAHRLQQQELAAVIQHALDGLNERQRMAVVLNKFEDMSYEEIAQVMNLSTKAIKSLRTPAPTCAGGTGYIQMDGYDSEPAGDYLPPLSPQGRGEGEGLPSSPSPLPLSPKKERRVT